MKVSELEIGNTYLRQARYAEAIHCYQKALKKSDAPLKKTVQFNLSYAERRLDNQRAATESDFFIGHTTNVTELRRNVASETATPRLILIAMVRNEYPDILDWLLHVFAMFDELHIIDHMSSDGTREFLRYLSAQDTKVHMYCCDEPGYFQSELMTHITHKKINRNTNSWVFFLDADEFLPFDCKNNLIRKLEIYKDIPVISLPWMNLVPTDIRSGGFYNRKYLKPVHSSRYSKIAIQPTLIPIDDFKVAQGNHALIFGRREDHIFPMQIGFSILHIPIRSAEQLHAKVKQGSNSYRKMGGFRRSDFGNHWDDIYGVLEAEDISVELIASIARDYGERLSPPYSIALNDLLAMGYQEFVLEPSLESTGTFRELKLLYDKSAEILTENPRETSIIFKNGKILDEEIISKTQDNTSTLASNKVQSVSEFLFSEQILDFISGSTIKIDYLTPTAWGGHIPFMFSLFRFLEPGNYVELGTHYGASFFAACQAAKRFNIKSHLYAVDLWEGDKHSGRYEENVYRDVSWLTNQHFSDIATLIRKDFSEASQSFPADSIDLLHIDGLHTYEAVKRDFEVWLPKIKKNGVILFHDTIETRDDFGVWKLWDEIKEQYVSFNFTHSHGLGVLALGSPQTNPVAGLLVEINRSSLAMNWFDSFFTEVGSLSLSEAVARIKCKELQAASSIEDDLVD